MPFFSEIALPLTDLTTKGAPNKVNWEKPQENAFDSLKQILIHSLVLKLPDISKPFILQTDASDGGIDAVLLQLEDEVGIKLPVAYASRKLKSSECKYSTIKKECLGMYG